MKYCSLDMLVLAQTDVYIHRNKGEHASFNPISDTVSPRRRVRTRKNFVNTTL